MSTWTGQQTEGFPMGGVQLHGGGSAAELAALIAKQRMAGQQQWSQSIGQVGKAVSGIMAQQRQNAIADALLKRDASPDEQDFYKRLPGSPADKYKIFLASKEREQKSQSLQTNEDYRRAMMLKALGGGEVKEPRVKPTPVDTTLSKYGLTQDDLQGIDFSSLNLEDEKGNPLADSGEHLTKSKLVGDLKENQIFVTGTANGKAFRVPRSVVRTIAPQIQQNVATVPTGSANGAPTAQGPPDGAIAYLKAHPETASQFDAKYGAGTSSTFLGQ